MPSLKHSSMYSMLIGLITVAVQVQAAQRGLPWGTDDRWAPAFANTSISWYHHWQDPSVSQMASNIEYVPMDWGPKYASKWAARTQQMNQTLPKHILAYNEPDVSSQANMTPSDAVTAFMTDLQPWRQRGVLVSSPQIVWNITWMDAFMSGLKAQGGDVDFMAIHYYGAWNDLTSPKSYIQKVNKRYGKNVWITELGTTLASNGTEDQVRSFMNSMMTWVDQQSYIDRTAWTGAYSVTNPPDSYLDFQCAMFYPNATLRAIGQDFAQITTLTPTSTSSSVSATPTTSSSSSSSSSTSASTTARATSSSTASPTSTSSSSTKASTSSSSSSTTKTSTSITPTSTSKSSSTSTMKTSTSSSSTKAPTSTSKAASTTTSSSSTKKPTTTAAKSTTSTKKASASTSSTKKCSATHKSKPKKRCKTKREERINKGNVVSAAKRWDS